jgi:hypothetical protein
MGSQQIPGVKAGDFFHIGSNKVIPKHLISKILVVNLVVYLLF